MNNTFLNSLKHVDEYKQLVQLEDQRSSWAAIPTEMVSTTNLPDHVLAFMQEIMRPLEAKRHLDPHASVFSPSMVFDLGETTACFRCWEEGDFCQRIKPNRKLDIFEDMEFFRPDPKDRSRLFDTFDLITCFLPFGVEEKYGEEPREDTCRSGHKSGELLSSSLKQLDDDGTAIFILPDQSFVDGVLESTLMRTGFYIDAIFALPPGTLNDNWAHSDGIPSRTEIAPNVIVIKKIYHQSTFYAELNDDHSQLQEIIRLYQNRIAGNISALISHGDFRGAVLTKLTSHLKTLEGQNKSYRFHWLRDICAMKRLPAIHESRLKSRLTRRIAGHLEASNIVYVPVSGNSMPTQNLADITNIVTHWGTDLAIPSQDYMQLNLNPDIVLTDYMTFFFKSLMGRQLLESSRLGFINPKLSWETLERLPVLIPSLSVQKEIIAAANKIEEIKHTLTGFADDLIGNPTLLAPVSRNLDNIMNEVEKFN